MYVFSFQFAYHPSLTTIAKIKKIIVIVSKKTKKKIVVSYTYENSNRSLYDLFITGIYVICNVNETRNQCFQIKCLFRNEVFKKYNIFIFQSFLVK